MMQDSQSAGGEAKRRGPPGVRWSFVFRQIGRLLVLTLCAMPLAFWLALWLPARWDNVGSDTVAYVHAAEAVQQDATMYDPLPPKGPHDLGIYYLYPPFLAAALSFVRQGAREIHNLLLVLNTLAVLGISFILPRIAGRSWKWGFPLAAAMAFNVPLLVTIDIGNIEPLVNFLSLASIVAAPAASAALLVVATALKVNPLWPLAVVVVRGGSSAHAGAIVAAMLVLIVTVVAVGAGDLVLETIVWLESVAPTLAQGQFASAGAVIFGHSFGPNFFTGNISPVFAPLFAFPRPAPGVELHTAARTYLAVMQFGIPLLVAWLTRRQPWRYQAGYVLCAALVSAPILRLSQLHVLLVLPALLLRRRSARSEVRASPTTGAAHGHGG